MTPRYKLRTLLIVLAVLPPLIASGCWLLMDDAELALILAVVFGVPVVLIVLWGAVQELVERIDKR